MSEIISNRKARHDFHILETLEAGIALKGTEVKALRAGKAQIREAHARVENGEIWLYNAHIDEYDHGNRFNHRPTSPRKLLLHRAEIRRLQQASQQDGHTLTPLSFYWKNGRVKVALGVARGKMHADKRETLKRRDADREMRRVVAGALRKHT